MNGIERSIKALSVLDRDPVTPVRVAVGLMLMGVVFGWLVGAGATAWILLVLPVIAAGFIKANA